jgi:hypothetical protein
VEDDWRVVLDDYSIEMVAASGAAVAAATDAGEIDVSDWFGNA